MSLPLNMTLAELRNGVLLRCGYSTEGNQASAVAPMVNSMIAGAERELYHEATWLSSQTRTTIPLTVDEGIVDWPDDCEPGEILSVWVVRTDSGALNELTAGVMINERDSADNGESGCPIVYEYMDEQIHIKPPPSSDYDDLVVTYKRAPRLVQETDRCVVDAELLIQRAVFKFKEFNNMPVGQVELANHERYLTRLRSANGNNSGFIIGGHKSWRSSIHRGNRITRGARTGNGASYTTDWNPW